MNASAVRLRAGLRRGAGILSSLSFTLLAATAAAAPDSDQPPSRTVREDGRERPLWLDRGRVVEFGGQGSGRPVIRSLQPGEKSEDPRPTGSDVAVSPLFVDSVGQPQAPAGGVIVALKEALPEPQARAQLEASGLVPLRRINEQMWLVDAAPGVPSLDLAERLQAEGRFDFVQPNWWRPRTTK